MKRTVLFRIAMVLAAGFLFVSGCAMTSSTLAPLPEKINIAVPDPGIGKLAKFCGKWEGFWNNPDSQAVIIIVEKIDRKKINAIYSYGPYKSIPGNWGRVSGEVLREDYAVLEWINKDGKRTSISLKLVSDNKLQAEFRKETFTLQSTLVRSPL